MAILLVVSVYRGAEPLRGARKSRGDWDPVRNYGAKIGKYARICMKNGQKLSKKLIDNFFISTPIFLKFHWNQVHRSTHRMSEANFWISHFFPVFSVPWVHFLTHFEKRQFFDLKWPPKFEKDKSSKICFGHFVNTPMNLRESREIGVKVKKSSAF